MRGIRIHPKPYCPNCGAQMVLRKPKGYKDYDPFWGCSQYPECRGSRNIKEDGTPEED
jgi:DNA topoisomerase-1